MTEQFSNNTPTTLTSDISAAATTVPVNSVNTFPTLGNFRIVIDDEIMLVTSISGTNFVVTRAQESTTAAPHFAGATVAHPITAGGMTQAIYERILIGTYANLPTAGSASRIYYPTDHIAYYVDNGVSWQGFIGPFNYPITPLDDSVFSWDNQSSSTTSTFQNIVTLNVPTTQSSYFVSRYKTKAPPYTITVMLQAAFFGNTAFGIGWRESSSGKHVIFGYSFSGGLRIIKETNTTYNSDYAGNVNGFSLNTGDGDAFFKRPVVFLRITHDGTNRGCWLSENGIVWTQCNTEPATDFLTPDQVLYSAVGNGHAPAILNILSWKET